MSTPPSSSNINHKPVHLVILIHGLYGSPANMATIAEELGHAHAGTTSSSPSSSTSASEVGSSSLASSGPGVEPENVGDGQEYDFSETNQAQEAQNVLNGGSGIRKGKGKGIERGDDLIVYSCHSFGWGHTWDGVDNNGIKAANEVIEEVARIEKDGKKVEWISFVGYSLGGLIARYAIAVLDTHRHFFEDHIPAAFITAATPHLGVLKYGSTTNTIIHTLGKRLLSRTGRHLYCSDKDENGKCLLQNMTDQRGPFIKALQKFNKVAIFANGCHDLTVPYPTASISSHDPFESYNHESGTGLQVDIDENHIISSWKHLPQSSSSSSPNLRRRMSHVVEERELLLEKDGSEEREDDIDIRVTVTTVKKKEGQKRIRPRMPPIFFLKPPFTYLLVVLLPFIFPLWIVFLLSFMTINNIKSYKRQRMLKVNNESRPLLLPPVSQSVNPRLLDIQDEVEHPPSGSMTPPFQELETSAESSKVAIPLLLTDRQKQMIRNIDQALPNLERVIAWFPWVFNTHATLIARDPVRFPAQNEARGIVRLLASKIIESIEL